MVTFATLSCNEGSLKEATRALPGQGLSTPLPLVGKIRLIR